MLKQTHQEVLERMGSSTSDAEAWAMEEICHNRAIDDLDDVDDHTFFKILIPMAVRQAKGK